MTTNNYTPPASVMRVLQYIEYEQALPAGDPRYVPTQAARSSEMTFDRLARKFVWDPDENEFFPPTQKHVLFFGHIGSGKTTELRQYAERFNQSGHFLVVEVDVVEKLDRNNLQYADVLMAMAESLLQALPLVGADLGEAALTPLRQWFQTKLIESTKSQELAAEIKASAELGGGIPGLLKLVASVTNVFKTGSSHKTTWREEIRTHFTSLASTFNALIRDAEAELTQLQGRERRVLFVIDGTDKMRDEDTSRFFVQDSVLLLEVETLALYTAPLDLKYDGRLGGRLDDLILPMMKLYDRQGQRWTAGWEALRAMLLHRAARSLFEPDGEGDVQIERLIAHSGGHPRELLRLLKQCCEVAEKKIDGKKVLDAVAVSRAIELLAAEYRRFLKPEDYELLARIDTHAAHQGNNEQAQKLLHRLALMEYNDGSWRCSHPVIRTLEGYQLAKQAMAATAAAPTPDAAP